MIPLYEERKENLYVIHKLLKHTPPHVHNSMEFVYVTQGALELGVGQELFHMEKGDFAIAFPDVIHHYQVLSPGINKAICILAAPALGGQFLDELQKYCPKDPVIKKEKLHSDIFSTVKTLAEETKTSARDTVVEQAYVQIILARSMPCFHFIEKSSIGSDDIIYQTVSYIAKHFREELSLESMAKDLGVSKYVLSRVFSGTFHRNFSQYVNEQRLNYVSTMLECTNQTITEICMDAGFESQRTFNRVFQEKYKMTPREYRNLCREKYLVRS